MKKLAILILAISLMGCSFIDKAKANIKEEVSGYKVAVVNTGEGYVYKSNGKLYYKANDYVEGVEIGIGDVAKYGGKILIR